MFTIQNFSDLENSSFFITNNIVSLSYTDLTQNEPSLPHSHQYTEVMLVVEGKGELLVNQQQFPFNKGKLYFINPHTEHLEYSKGVLKYYVAKINRFTLNELNSSQSSRIFILDIDYGTEKNILARFSQIMEDCKIKDSKKNLLLSLELSYLYYYLTYIVSNRYLIQSDELKAASSKIQSVVDYIASNYSLELKIPELAQKFSFSNNNLIYHFKKEFGLSPSEYIKNVRIQAAKNLLKNSDFSITQIATMCGFSHPSFFGKTFKNVVGASPSEYREKN